MLSLDSQLTHVYLRSVTTIDQYDLAKCLTEFLWTAIIHGDDVLAHTNWELGEQWLRTYRLVSCATTGLFLCSGHDLTGRRNLFAWKLLGGRICAFFVQQMAPCSWRSRADDGRPKSRPTGTDTLLRWTTVRSGSGYIMNVRSSLDHGRSEQ